MLHHVVEVGLDDLARHRADDRRVAEMVGEARARRGELELQRVAVERAHAGHVAVVVEGLAAERGQAQVVESEDLVFLDRRQVRALPARIEDALDRVDVVGGDELAPLAAERGVVREIDARLDPDREDLEVVGDLGHGRRGRWPQAHRARQELVLVRRLEDVGGDRA